MSNKTKKRIAIVGTVGVPACYGGYETLVENLLRSKQDPELLYTVYCTSTAYKTRLKEYLGARLVYLPLKANGCQSFLYDSLSFFHAWFTHDIILSLGTAGCWIIPLLKIFRRIPVIINYDGLDNKRAKFNSFSSMAITLTRACANSFSTVGISDNAAIRDYVKKNYHRDSVLIEYGGDNAKPVYNSETLKNKYGLQERQYLLAVARIEPENNIRIILEAAARLPDKKFVIVGNWNRSEWGKKLRLEFSHFANIQMLDPIYEPEQINLLRSNCELYLHGHSMGGTNPSLVEIMNLGLPVFAFDVVYNRATTEEKAFYFHDTASLVDGITTFSKEDLARNAESMKEIAQRRYTWQIICQKYESLLKQYL